MTFRTDKLWRWIAWKLPKELVAWCGIRIVAFASTGKYSHVAVPNLRAMEVIKVWMDEEE